MKPQAYPLWVIVTVNGVRYAAPVVGWENGYAMVPLGRGNLSSISPDVECSFTASEPVDLHTLTQTRLAEKTRHYR